MADEDKPNTQEEIIPSRPAKVNRKRVFIVGGILLMILIGAGSYLYVFRKTPKQPESNSSQAGLEDIPALKTIDKHQPKTEHDKTIAAADKLIASTDYEGAIKLLQEYEPKAKEPAHRFAATARLGSVYAYKGDYKSALTWLEQAQRTGQPGSDDLALSIAIAAEKVGDKPKAIAAYRKAIELLRARPHPASETNITQYQAKIKALGG